MSQNTNQMKTKFIAMFLIAAVSMFSQSKKEILLEIETYSRSVAENKKFDVSEKQVWDAMYLVALQEYPEIRRESESKGYIEAFIERENYRESLTMEIRGTGPYMVSYSVKREMRSRYGSGSYGNWYSLDDAPQKYFLKLQSSLYKFVFGTHEYPSELLDKITAYNQGQKKDKNKILKGRDF